MRAVKFEIIRNRINKLPVHYLEQLIIIFKLNTCIEIDRFLCYPHIKSGNHLARNKIPRLRGIYQFIIREG